MDIWCDSVITIFVRIGSRKGGITGNICQALLTHRPDDGTPSCRPSYLTESYPQSYHSRHHNKQHSIVGVSRRKFSIPCLHQLWQ